MIRVLVADDHPIFRKGLTLVLAEDPEIVVAAEAGSGQEALDLLRKGNYDVVVMDLNMPGMTGLEALQYIQTEMPELPVLILSIYPEEQFALRALRSGAAGYVTKTSVPDELVKAVRRVAGGGRYITANVAEQMAEAWRNPASARAPHETLSERECQVMLRLGRGQTVSEIAADLTLSVKTVSTHRAHLLKKMNLETNAQLMRYVLDNKLVD